MFKVVLRMLKINSKFALLKYKESWEIPEPIYPNQVQIETIHGGICGSDMNQIFVNISMYASILASNENPSEMGHEIFGRVTKTGDEVTSVSVGDRVLVNPISQCQGFGFQPCPACKTGDIQHCLTMTGIGDGTELEEKYNTQGGFGGFCGGGYSERSVFFEQQCIKIPDSIPDDIAVLIEQLAVGIHAVAKNPPKDTDTVLVCGAGIIGLMVIAAIRGLKSNCRIITIARYPFQAEWAKKLGSDEIIADSDSKTLYEEVANATNSRLFQPKFTKKVVYGLNGTDLIYDSVATETSVDNDIRLVRSGGKIVLIGMGFNITKKVDWAIPVYKEINIVGAMCYDNSDWETAVKITAEDPEQFRGLITHKYKIDDFKSAFTCMLNKSKSEAIKIVFDYTLP